MPLYASATSAVLRLVVLLMRELRCTHLLPAPLPALPHLQYYVVGLGRIKAATLASCTMSTVHGALSALGSHTAASHGCRLVRRGPLLHSLHSQLMCPPVQLLLNLWCVHAGGYEQLVQWGSFEVDQLNTHPQKLLNEFSLVYMVADFIFFLLPFTPDGGHAHAPPPAACLLCLPALPAGGCQCYCRFELASQPVDRGFLASTPHCCPAAAEYVHMIHHSISVVYLVGWGPPACCCICAFLVAACLRRVSVNAGPVMWRT